MSKPLWCTVLLLAAGCDAHRELDLARKHGEACEKGRRSRCGDLLFLDCDSAVDGPSYYMRWSDGSTVSTCGGACWHARGPAAEECKTLCPPAEWTCK